MRNIVLVLFEYSHNLSRTCIRIHLHVHVLLFYRSNALSYLSKLFFIFSYQVLLIQQKIMKSGLNMYNVYEDCEIQGEGTRQNSSRYHADLANIFFPLGLV